MINWLDPACVNFPPVHRALREPNGLLAAGGALTTEWLLAAYSDGIFPWFSEGDPILWWSPDPRTVFNPKAIKIRRSLRQSLRNRGYTFKADHAFHDVIKACAEPRKDQGETWIVAPMQAAYCNLHEEGYAHSIECWQEGRLVGGLYGVAIGSLFFGESMFSHERDASKGALIFLAHLANQVNGPLIDCQMPNPHLDSLGAMNIPRQEFVQTIKQHLRSPQPFPIGSWQHDIEPVTGDELLTLYQAQTNNNSDSTPS